MLKIAHRVNDPDVLRCMPKDLGVEMDIHALGDRLVVTHDAFLDGPDLETWLDAYDHRFVIFNVKEEGTETRVRDMAIARGIEEFFLLDLSVPALVKMARLGERRMAARVSEFEPIAGALSLAENIEWVWLDSFETLSLNRDDYDKLRAAGFRLCLVSPELQGRAVSQIAEWRRQFDASGMVMDAVCTKRPDLW